ncbi:MAG: hypothetical protein ACRDYZ_06675 [Acidimicrobiales bacterium]
MDLEAYVDVVPWLVFVVVGRRAGLGIDWAAAAAVGCGAAIGTWSHWRGRRTPIGWVAVGVFGSIAVVALVVDRPAQWFEPTLRAASVLGLAAAAFLSLHRRPLSEAYTAERVPVHLRAEEAFDRVNRRITVAWGVGALLVAGSFAAVGAASSAVPLTMFDWVVPIAVLGIVLRWVAVVWNSYLAGADGGEAPPLRETTVGFGEDSLRGVRDDTLPAPPEPRITYLPGVQPGS